LALTFESSVEEIADKADAALIVLKGEIRSGDEPELRSVLMKELEAGRSALLLDFRSLELICSAGLSALLYVNNDCKRKGGKLILFGLPSPIQSIMTMTNLISVFTICDTREEAVAAIG